MDSKTFIFDEHIQEALDRWGWSCSVDEGRLMLVELAVKVSNGYHISHAENGFLSEFNLLRKNNSFSRLGVQFLCAMLYESSNMRSLFCELSIKYRIAQGGE